MRRMIIQLFYNFTKNISDMTTIIINEKTKKGQIILDLIREMGVGKIIDNKMEAEDIPNEKTIKAIQEAKEGKTIKCIDFDDYLKKVK
jgi:hypothetical protein